MVGHKIDPGFGENYNRSTKRLINKDGSFNIQKRGFRIKLHDLYQYLKDVSVGWLALLVLGSYLLINVFFALLYLWCGIENLHGTDPELSPFLNAFFFSVHTFTTVGYGMPSPHGLAVNLVVTLEALTGWVGFAIITGVVFSRFSKPNARILYSDNAIITPHKDGDSLQFRIANKRSNVLIEMEARVMLMVHDKNHNRHYFNLPLERSSLHFFPLNWTIVHPIDTASPMYNLKPADLLEQEAEILILVKGFDETFGQEIHSRFSYRYDEICWNVRFKKAYEISDDGETIFYLARLHELEALD